MNVADLIETRAMIDHHAMMDQSSAIEPQQQPQSEQQFEVNPSAVQIITEIINTTGKAMQWEGFDSIDQSPKKEINPGGLMSRISLTHFVDETQAIQAQVRAAASIQTGKRRRRGSTIKFDHLDGYHWLKYGQKVVNSTMGRRRKFYFRCAYAGCSAKKQIEYPFDANAPLQMTTDKDLVITCNEKHSHEESHDRGGGRWLPLVRETKAHTSAVPLVRETKALTSAVPLVSETTALTSAVPLVRETKALTSAVLEFDLATMLEPAAPALTSG